MGKVNRVSNKRFAQTDAVCIEVAHLAAGVCVAIGLILLAHVREVCSQDIALVNQCIVGVNALVNNQELVPSA